MLRKFESVCFLAVIITQPCSQHKSKGSSIVDMELSCSWKWSLGGYRYGTICSQSDPWRIPQTTEEKIIKRDRTHHTAETADQKEHNWVSPGQKIEQGVLLMQLLRLSRIATPRSHKLTHQTEQCYLMTIPFHIPVQRLETPANACSGSPHNAMHYASS